MTMLRGDRLKILRQQHNYTHQQFADLLVIHVRQITRYENGEVDPGGAVIARMATIFSVSSDYLLGLTDAPTPEVLQGDLTATERKLLTALRTGDFLNAIRIIVNENDKS